MICVGLQAGGNGSVIGTSFRDDLLGTMGLESEACLPGT